MKLPFIGRLVATTLLTIGIALAGILAVSRLLGLGAATGRLPSISVQAQLPGVWGAKCAVRGSAEHQVATARQVESVKYILLDDERRGDYPPVPQRGDDEATQQDAPPAAAAFESEISGLRQVVELLQAQLDETRRDRDRWADTATAALRVLPPPAEKKRRWWWP